MRIGLDIGTVRIGVARTDPSGTLAVPVATLRRGTGDIAAIHQLVTQYEAVEVVVGYPLSLSGRPGPAAEAARDFAQELCHVVAPVPVRLVDERLSTVSAGRELRAAGRSSRSGRAVVDQAAAVIILTYALDQERSSGQPPGERVQE